MIIKLPRYYSSLSIPEGLTEEAYLYDIYKKLFGREMPQPLSDSWFYETEAPGWTRGHPDEYDARLGYIDPAGRFRFHIIDQGKFSRINFTMCYSVIMDHKDIGSSADWKLRADTEDLRLLTQYCIFDRSKRERIFIEGNQYLSLEENKAALTKQREDCEALLDQNHPGWKNDPLTGWS